MSESKIVVERIIRDNTRLRQLEQAGTRWYNLFGTPERAARTLENLFANCNGGFCFAPEPEDATYGALLEWLREEGETE